MFNRIIYYLIYIFGNFIEIFFKKKNIEKIGKNPLVSIIITNYNYGQYLEESLKSALNQTYKNKEIILIDDASTDKQTLKKLKIIKNQYSNSNKIKFYYLKKNVGLPAARNFGIKQSEGNLICCLDSDDKLEKSYIQKAVEVFKKQNSQIGIVYSYCKIFGHHNFIWKPLKANLFLIKKSNCIHVSAVFRKQIWNDIKGFREDLRFGYEDWDFWYRALRKGWKTFLIKEPLLFHRTHDKNMVKFSNKYRNKIIRQIFYEGH